MSDHPRITVVTPTYNQGHFLEETVRSVVLQGYPNLEYIIIDGNSSDGTMDVIRKYERYVSYWVSEKDQGPADAINKGFRKSTGSILAWLNSDDVYQPGALEKVAAAFEANPEADVVYGNMYWMDRDAKILAEKRQTPFLKRGYQYGGADLQQPATFWRRGLFEKSGGMDHNFRAAFDAELFFKFIALGGRFKYIKEFLASFRVHPDQISDVMLATARDEMDRIRAKHLRYSARSIPGVALRNLGRLQRIFWYARQGDLVWLLSRIPDRMKSLTAKEATGPRSKGM